MTKAKLPIVVLIAAIIAGAFMLLRPPNKIIPQDVVLSLNPEFMDATNLVKPIVKEMRKLHDGTEVECYVITCGTVPPEHQVGPWVPEHVDDGKDKGGIWIKDGHVYDVDGNFVAHLDELYDDPEWNLVREDGTIKVTDTREAFEAAARPDVDPRYHNHAVACPDDVDEWKDYHTVYVIPVNPQYHERPTSLHEFGGGHDRVGFALNGVKFDPPAPIEAIIKAHTIAPFDDAGGHVNPFAGYHYHAATGHTKEIAQLDGHAPLIGYALDGFAIYAHLDESGNASEDLDDCSGHYDDVRGYHYHAGAAGDNQIIGAFRGIPGMVEIVKN